MEEVLENLFTLVIQEMNKMQDYATHSAMMDSKVLVQFVGKIVQADFQILEWIV